MKILKNERHSRENIRRPKELGSIEKSSALFDEFDIKITPGITPEEMVEVASALINFTFANLKKVKN